MGANAFYDASDCETWGEGKRPSDYRSAFQVDRDRVIHSAAFRKLQSKTQVYLSGEYDFYRTRLTHSIEVAQIGRSICAWLEQASPFLCERFRVDSDLVEAVCLSHDLGHPPFGHGGERSLNDLFRHAGGFEGNAQTLRLLAETLYASRRGLGGMAPTRAFMDGVMKYKSLRGELGEPERHFLYDSQLPCRDFAHAAAPQLIGPQPKGAFDGLVSIECQIMDWADDTAYCLNDIVDGVRAGFISLERLERWAAQTEAEKAPPELVERLAEEIRKDPIEAVFSRKIGSFIQACRLEEAPASPLSAVSNRHAFRLAVEGETRRLARFYKRVASDLIFRSAPLRQMEFKGDRILRALWEALSDWCLGERRAERDFLPELPSRLLGQARRPEEAFPVARDYLASLTDGQALRVYKRLFDPEYGSLADLD